MEKETKIQEPVKPTPESIERHSYNNPEDNDEGLHSQMRLIEEIVNNMEAFSVDLRKEDGIEYAIIKSKKDDKVVFKTDSRYMIGRLFPKKD